MVGRLQYLFFMGYHLRKLTVRPWQIGVGRLVSIKHWLFSGSMFIYQRVNHFESELMCVKIPKSWWYMSHCPCCLSFKCGWKMSRHWPESSWHIYIYIYIYIFQFNVVYVVTLNAVNVMSVSWHAGISYEHDISHLSMVDDDFTSCSWLKRIETIFHISISQFSQFLMMTSIISIILLVKSVFSCCLNPFGCVWKCRVPLNPMVLLIIIPMKNGYFIGNINPTFSDKPIFWPS